MLIKAKALKGYKLESLDGEIGKAREFYFDDRHWTIRYLVADTGSWLTGRQVLLSPYDISAVIPDQRHIAIKLTKRQIEESPSLDSDKPVSRQFEYTLLDYYTWPAYWRGPYMWGSYAYPYMAGPYPRIARQEVAEAPGNEEVRDAHLRSANTVAGYHIQSTDGTVGHVEDFIIDEETWAIRYLVVDTRNWWPGKKVLISPRWIDRISWDKSKVFVNVSRETVRQAPEYTEDALLTRDYESSLYHHYDRLGYWVDEPAAQEHSR